MIMMIIISNILCIIYAMLEGIREANAKHLESSSVSVVRINSSVIYNIQRLVVLSIIGLFLLWHTTSIDILFNIASLISMALIFPYIHNNTYLIIRYKMNPYLTKSDESESIMDKPTLYLKSKLRTKLAILGVISQIIIHFLK